MSQEGIPSHTSASVTVGQRRNELQRLPIPELRDSDGLLRVLASGVCGSDVKKFDLDLPVRVMGHETVGQIAAMGEFAADRWGVSIGDTVLVEEYLPCGHCAYCRAGDYRMCLQSDGKATVGALRYGTTPLAVAPGLWGGFSEYMYLHPASVMHKVPAGVSPSLATLSLPLSNGYEWVHRLGQCGLGDTVVVFGPGQQGLGCVMAAREAGAGTVICVGLEGDRDRLSLAEGLGADLTLVFSDALADQIRSALGGAAVDLVVDTASGTQPVFSAACDVLRKQGRLVLAAAAKAPANDLPLEAVTRKALTLRGARGHSFASVQWALQALGRESFPFAMLTSATFGLDDVGGALKHAAKSATADSMHAVVLP